MKFSVRFIGPLVSLGLLAFVAAGAAVPAQAATAAEIDARVDLALATLTRQSPTARALVDDAVAVLVFPNIVKAGFGIGGQFGEGALRRGGATVGYYNIASASFGFQIGAQSYAQIIYFMTEDAVSYLDRSGGFEIGADANVALVTEGLAADVTSSTVQDPIIAMVFSQTGLMAGVTIEGSKITRINPR
jgi:lipid-binding SYLF domain-containing protein